MRAVLHCFWMQCSLLLVLQRSYVGEDQVVQFAWQLSDSRLLLKAFLLQWKRSHSPGCNIKPAHLSVKCTLTSPPPHTRSISRCFQKHKVTLSQSCFRRRVSQECVHVQQAQGSTLSQANCIFICFFPKTFASSSVSPVSHLFPFFWPLCFSCYLSVVLLSFPPLRNASARMLCCWSEWRKRAWPQETSRGGETFDARTPDRS